MPQHGLVMVQLHLNCFGAFVFMKKFTREGVNEKLSEIGSNIKMLDEYVGSNVRSRFICRNGHITIKMPTFAIKGQQCKTCEHDSRRETQDGLNKKLESIGSSLRIIGPYAGEKTEASFMCKNGHEITIRPSTALKGNSCPMCTHERKEASVNTRLELIGSKMRLIGAYTGSSKKSLFVCDKGHKTMKSIGSTLSGKGCHACQVAQKTLTWDGVNGVLRSIGSRLKMTGPYLGAFTNTEFTCDLGHVTKKLPSNAMKGQGCGSCTKRGFNPNRPTIFYVFALICETKEGIGFGITHDFESRHRVYRKLFKQTKTNASLLLKVELETGHKAREIESALKQHPAIIDFGIDGFRTECLPIEYKDFILSTIHQYSNSE